MERVAFLIEETNERIGCLLNPETLVMRRMAGVRPRRSATGQLTGEGLTDDPLLYTGGGRTELELDLLFDVSLAGSSITTDDVRDLTRPLWNLAENAARQEGYGQPPLVRFIWGKSWNIPGIVVAVAERLEYFTPEGVPRRSWLRMRMLRANEPPPEPPPARTSLPPDSLSPEELEVPEGSVNVQEIIGGAPAADGELQEMIPSTLQANGLTATTAPDIIASALAENQARESINAALDTIGGAARTMLTELSSLTAGEGEGEEGEEPSEEEREERAAAETVEEETNSILSSLEMVASAVETGLVGAVTTATATISSAIDTIAPTLEKMTSEAGAFVAQKVAAAVEQIAPAVEAMREAAATVARAVKEKSAAVIAAAVGGLESATETIQVGLSTVATVASAAGAGAVEIIGSATETVGEALEALKSTGETAARELLPAALEKLASGAEALWAAGETVAVKAVESAARLLSIALKNVTAATEAIAAVLITQAAGVVRSAVGTIRTALETVGTGPEAEARASGDVTAVANAASKALLRIESTMTIIEPHADPETQKRLPEALGTVRAVVEKLDQLEPARRGEAAENIAQVLEMVTGAVEQAVSQEKAATAELVRSAIETGEPAAEERARRARNEARSLRAGFGQRLDQLAHRHYGDAALWRVLAAFNNVEHPLSLPSGQLLRVPPASALRSKR